MPDPTSYSWGAILNEAVPIGSAMMLPTPGFKDPMNYNVAGAEVVYGGEVLGNDEFVATWAADYSSVSIINDSDEEWPPQDFIAIAVAGNPFDSASIDESFAELTARVEKLETEQDAHDEQIKANDARITANEDHIEANAELITENTNLIIANTEAITANADAIANIPAPTPPSALPPRMDGVADTGSQEAWARGDHVHPTDTTRYDAANPAGYQTVNDVTTALAPYALTSALPPPSNIAPRMDGVSTAGAAASWSRSDHVHPNDTTKYDTTNPANYQTATQVTASLAPYALASSVPAGSSTAPTMDGVAAPGVATTWARGDHKHPTDTSRYDATNPSQFQTLAQVNNAVTRINVVPTAPVCSVTAATTQSVVNGTALKIKFDTVEYDTTGAFDLVNNRFKPTAPGYYQVNFGAGLSSTVNTTYTSIYKNGTEYRRSVPGSNDASTRLSVLVHLNGTTDYIEGWLFANANGTTSNGAVTTAFTAYLAQASAT